MTQNSLISLSQVEKEKHSWFNKNNIFV